MSWTSRAREYIAMGLTDEEATALVQAEREAAERDEPAPELPPKVLEKYGQYTLDAYRNADGSDAEDAA